MAKVSRVEEVPNYMQKGSNGPAVTVLQAFLYGTGLGNGIDFDSVYGEVTAGAVKDLQLYLRIDADGNFGPATRAAVEKQYGFSFHRACLILPRGRSLFVQPNGEEHYF